METRTIQKQKRWEDYLVSFDYPYMIFFKHNKQKSDKYYFVANCREGGQNANSGKKPTQVYLSLS